MSNYVYSNLLIGVSIKEGLTIMAEPWLTLFICHAVLIPADLCAIVTLPRSTLQCIRHTWIHKEKSDKQQISIYWYTYTRGIDAKHNLVRRNKPFHLCHNPCVTARCVKAEMSRTVVIEMMAILRTLWKSSHADSQALSDRESKPICHFSHTGLWDI